jgi:Mannosyltransferase (PIG-V)
VSSQPAASEFTPRWVRLADFAALGLAALALWIAMVGGLRQVVFGRVVSVTSPIVVLYGACSLLLVRHLLYPRPHAAVRLRTLGQAISARPAFGAALRAFLASRPAVFAIGLFATAAVGLGAKPGFVLSHDVVANLPARFDAGWYGEIALDGYDWDASFEHQRNVAFFPALPILMRTLGVCFRIDQQGLPREGRMLRALWAGTVISLAAFLWALHYLVRLGQDLIGFERAASAALLLSAYPFAVFYSAPYSEALFLLAAVATFFHFLRDEWIAAAAWGALAGLTRPNGCFLTLPLMLLAVQPARRLATARPDRPSPRFVRLLVAGTPVAGMLAFTVYLHTLTGIWFVWARSHEAWGRTFDALAPLATLVSALREQPVIQLVTAAPYDTLNFLGAFFASVMVWPVFRKLGVVWGVFMVVNLLPPLLSGGVLSMGRLTATLFPLFLALAAMIPARSVPAWTAAFGAMQGLSAALFFTWRELY